MSTGLGERLKQKRIELGLSQEELAKRLGLKSKSTICKIERGEDNLTTTAIRKYAEALHTTPAYLMGWESTVSGHDKGDTIIVSSLHTLTEEEAKAKELFELYEKANPDVQQAVELILRSSQQTS